MLFNLPIRIMASMVIYSLMIWAFIATYMTQRWLAFWICPFLDESSSLHLLGWIFRYIASFVIWLSPFWRVQVLGPRPKEHPVGTLVMSNHLSNADCFFLSAALLPWETKYIAKASLFSVPFGGWAMRLAGDLAVHFTHEKDGWGVKKGSVKIMMDKCKHYLQLGLNITIFPEGGRSATGELKPFRDGFFKLALETQSPILPCAISGTEVAWPMHDLLLAPATVYVRIGQPISSKGHSIESLKQAVRVAMEAMQADLPTPQVGKSKSGHASDTQGCTGTGTMKVVQ